MVESGEQFENVQHGTILMCKQRSPIVFHVFVFML